MGRAKFDLESLYGCWRPPADEVTTGYSILILVPGDLPVFLKIALEVCGKQSLDHLVETIVVPDKWLSGAIEIFDAMLEQHAFSSARLVKLRPMDRLLVRRFQNPHINNWLQFVRGVEAVRSTHALWHDADLFITEPNFLKRHFEMCSKHDLSCLGVSKVWDSWYENHGINHLTATWELMFAVKWVRSFTPLQHRGRDGVIAGERHVCDLTLWPQCHTPPGKIDRWQREWGFIHFGHVIAAYRWFRQCECAYEDEHFRILLIRLLIMAYDDSGWPYDIPALDILKQGLTESASPVTYLQKETARNYHIFRQKMQELVDSSVITAERAAILVEGMDPFDRYFAYS